MIVVDPLVKPLDELYLVTVKELTAVDDGELSSTIASSLIPLNGVLSSSTWIAILA